MSAHFIRPCKECGGLYKPTGKFQKYCNECKEKMHVATSLKRLPIKTHDCPFLQNQSDCTHNSSHHHKCTHYSERACPLYITSKSKLIPHKLRKSSSDALKRFKTILPRRSGNG